MKAAPLTTRPDFPLMTQSDIVSFFHLQMPRWLFSHSRYKSLPLEAKVAYTFLLNRFQLSRLNGWVNRDGEVFVIFPREALAEEMQISYRKAIECFKELAAANLIWERRLGRENANQIYLALVRLEEEDAEAHASAPFGGGRPRPAKPASLRDIPAGEEMPGPQVKECSFDSFGPAVSEGQDLQESHPSKTEQREIEWREKEVSQPDELEAILENCELDLFSPEPAAALPETPLENQESLSPDGPPSEAENTPLYSVVMAAEISPEKEQPPAEMAADEAAPTPEESAPIPTPARPKRQTTAAKADTEAEKLQAQRRADFFHTDFKELDRRLSPEQLQEWQAIYASYRSQSILTGEVTGVDTNTITFQNPETGQAEGWTIRSLVIISYRVKVIIPETEIWAAGEERPDHVTRSLVGAMVEYVILEVDRAGECAIASRKLAMQKQRRRFRSLHAGENGVRVPCRVLATGPKRCLLECGGFDIPCTQRDLSYTAIADLREKYRPGQELEAVLKGFSPETGKPVISVKEVNPNPFDGAELRHPVGCRRQAVISGKYAGGIFCSMKDGVTCLCLYSNNHFDTQFAIGDTVLIHITRYDERRKLIYARILAKW